MINSLPAAASPKAPSRLARGGILPEKTVNETVREFARNG